MQKTDYPVSLEIGMQNVDHPVNLEIGIPSKSVQEDSSQGKPHQTIVYPPQVHSPTSHLKFPRDRNLDGWKSSQKKDFGKEVRGVNRSSFKKKAFLSSNLKFNSPLIQNSLSQKEEQ